MHIHNFEILEPQKFSLSIYAHPDGYSCLAINNDNEEDYRYFKPKRESRDSLEDFKSLFYDNEVFTYAFKKISILCFSKHFTYVPCNCFDSKIKSDYEKFIFSEKDAVFLHNNVPAIDSEVLYPVQEAVYDFFCRSFVNIRFIHYSTPLIGYFRGESLNLSGRLMSVNLHPKGIDVICFHRGELLLANHFVCEKVQDTLYFILYVWKQLKFSNIDDFLLLSGNFSTRGKLVEHLELYIQNVNKLDEDDIALEQKILRI